MKTTSRKLQLISVMTGMLPRGEPVTPAQLSPLHQFSSSQPILLISDNSSRPLLMYACIQVHRSDRRRPGQAGLGCTCRGLSCNSMQIQRCRSGPCALAALPLHNHDAESLALHTFSLRLLHPGSTPQ